MDHLSLGDERSMETLGLLRAWRLSRACSARRAVSREDQKKFEDFSVPLDLLE